MGLAFHDRALALPYKISPWKGDDFSVGHKMRNGEIPPFPGADKVEAEVDFVIVGGGMSALVAAHRLKDHNFLLLEQYKELGGQSRGESRNGLWYSLGAAYFGDMEGPVADLCREFSLKPTVIGQDKNSYLWQKKWLKGVEGPESNILYRDFSRLEEDFESIWEKAEDISVREPASISELSRLDKMPFSSMLQGYDPRFKAIMNTFIASSSCGSLDTVSALAGAMLVSDCFQKSYVLPGGNPTLARALDKSLQGRNERVRTEAFVWHVEIGDDGAQVVFSDSQGMHRIKCRHVILTSPPMVSGRILANVKNSAKANLFWFRYGSYLVANILLKQKVFSGSYDNFTPGFSFADFILAETPYVKSGSYKADMGQVLTVYQPYLPGSVGRSLLLAGDRQAFAADIVKGMEQLTHLGAKIDEVVLSRWGHAIAVLQPQYFRRIGDIFQTNGDNYTLAHSSLFGLQCLETAVEAGMTAADRALGRK